MFPSQGYRFWDAAELEHLIRLKREGLSWVEIKVFLPVLLLKFIQDS